MASPAKRAKTALADDGMSCVPCVAAAPSARRTIPVIGNSKVFVGRGLLAAVPAELTPANGIKASKFVIVSDENVWPLYGKRLVDAFVALGGVTVHDVATSRARPGPAPCPALPRASASLQKACARTTPHTCPLGLPR